MNYLHFGKIKQKKFNSICGKCAENTTEKHKHKKVVAGNKSNICLQYCDCCVFTLDHSLKQKK